MIDEKFNLLWDNFKSSTVKTFRDLWEDQTFADVTLLTADAKQVLVHKVILSSSSPFFRNIFVMNPHQNILLYLKGTKYDDLMRILKFIYTGECEVANEELTEFLDTGKILQIQGLMEDTTPEFDTHSENKSTQGNQATFRQSNDSSSFDDIWNMTENVLSSQMISKDIENQPVNNCNVCEMIFDSEQGLSSHLSTKHNQSKKCDKCDYVLQGLEKMNNHTIKMHMGNQCDECETTFSTPYNFQQHMERAHFGTSYSCNKCDYQGTAKKNLQFHMTSKHNFGGFDCKQCVYKAGQSSDLNKHIAEVHDKVIYYCEECEYSTGVKQRLAKHCKENHDGLVLAIK